MDPFSHGIAYAYDKINLYDPLSFPQRVDSVWYQPPQGEKKKKKKNRKRKARRKSHRFYHDHKIATKHPKATLKRLAQGLPLKEIRKTWLPAESDFRGVGKMKIALRKRESEGFYE